MADRTTAAPNEFGGAKSDDDSTLVDTDEGHESPAGYDQLSVLETAAQRGIGPLSDQGLRVWHGESKPCVSCGELVPRDADGCDLCGQDLTYNMLERMKAYAGPWYVREHIRPFPGVTLERLIRQARRGVLTQTTVVRGPTTQHQWRFAAETPGLSQYLGCCWECHGGVSAHDMSCPACGADLIPTSESAVGRRARRRARALPSLNPQLAELSAAVRHAAPDLQHHAVDQPPRLGSIHTGWIAAALIVLLICGVIALVKVRTSAQAPAAAPRPLGSTSVSIGPTEPRP